MNAQEIIDKIGAGVKAASKTNQLFLGIEQSEFENADIHPEYVTTVKIAESLTCPDVVVSLETQMKMLRREAIGIVHLNHLKDKERRNAIKEKISRYEFGKKDSQRLDVLVRSTETLSPPYLMVEAKLGVRNLPGILTDIDRIVKLLHMYKEAGVLERRTVYGAVVFHMMQEGAGADDLQRQAHNFLAGISAHLSDISSKHPWLKSKRGLLSSCAVEKDVGVCQDDHDDGAFEYVIVKDRFAFIPGLVLLGNADDIPKVESLKEPSAPTARPDPAIQSAKTAQ